ncbi:hypothetical protein BV22DRAFT_440991 [Leucogyrophana mollusca]|uniref:Uncharacterized protein n=1 Tax=Leucogyrophana mollusca TaxID=85980 RepID=A0ACB8BKP8_9AGAM|nr:hypothetical protein BV22DRAFT_440991 [Leucogyrophana mollusca]
MDSETKGSGPGLVRWEPREGDITILLLGQSGAGKSTFINTAAGRVVVPVGHGMTTCTTKITPVVVSHPTDKSRRVVFIDTPGFDDTWVGDRETLKRIVKWLEKLQGEGVTLTGIIYLHEITQSRNAKEASGHLMTPVKLVHPGGAMNVVLTTTRWNDIQLATGSQREKQLSETYWKEMLEQGARTHRFDGTANSAWDAVKLIRDRGDAPPIKTELAFILENLPNKPRPGFVGGFFTFLFGGRSKRALDGPDDPLEIDYPSQGVSVGA